MSNDREGTTLFEGMIRSEDRDPTRPVRIETSIAAGER
jgi:hypothetical protein